MLLRLNLYHASLPVITNLGEAPSAMAVPAALGLATMRWALQPALAGIKHLNRLEQVLAAREYRESGLDEAVMLDQRGRVVSVVAGNLFVVRGGELLTPGRRIVGLRAPDASLSSSDWAPALGLSGARSKPSPSTRLEECR